MIIVAVKLFSILMNLGKIVLQVGCSDKIIQPISSTSVHVFIILVLISKQKHYTRSYYRKESAASSPMDQSQHVQFAE